MTLNEITKKVIEESGNQSDNPWLNSRNYTFKTLSKPQDKGKVGVILYKQYLEQLKCETKIVSDEGDIMYHTSDRGWVKDEVKTASATMKLRKRDNKYTTEHWFNQIRPSQDSWQGIVLVAVFPSYYQIYRMNREEYFRNRSIGAAGIAPGHTGTDELDQVFLVDNTNKNVYNEWELIYEGE